MADVHCRPGFTANHNRRMPKAPKPPKHKRKAVTPSGLRRFFFKLELLGKRRGDRRSTLDQRKDTSTSNLPSSTRISSSRYAKENIPPPSLPPQGHNVRLPSRVALQNEDQAEDAVVITALDTIPFCCHEDLVTMSRAELINVARSLNAKLPAAMALDVSPTIATSFIRSAIELVVGIRGASGVRQREEKGEDVLYLLESLSDMTISPPTSPLAMRGKNNGSEGLSVHVTPRLERLEEEEVAGEEEDVGMGTVVIREARNPKRRKVLAEVLGPLADAGRAAIVTGGGVQTPPRMRRAQSDRIATRASGIPVPQRVLRSQSQKIETVAREMTTGIDMSFVNTRRPVYRYKSKAKEGDGERVRVRPGLARQRFFGPSMPKSSQRSSEEENSSGTEAPVVGVKRKRSAEANAERQMVAGIRRMNIRV